MTSEIHAQEVWEKLRYPSVGVGILIGITGFCDILWKGEVVLGLTCLILAVFFPLEYIKGISLQLAYL